MELKKLILKLETTNNSQNTNVLNEKIKYLEDEKVKQSKVIDEFKKKVVIIDKSILRKILIDIF